MKVIWVTPSIPHPQGTGGCAHEFELVRAMIERGHEIEVVSTDLDDPLGPGELQRIGAGVTRLTWQRRRGPQNKLQMARALTRADPSVFIWLQRDRIRVLREALDDLQPRFSPDLVHITIGELAPVIGFASAPTAMFLFDSLTRELQGRLRVEPLPRRRLQRRIEVKRTLRYERHWYSRASGLASVSTVDAGWFEEMLGRPVEVIANPIADDFFEPPAVPRSRDVVAFIGTINHHPNEDALEWLLEDIWPRIREARPNTRLVVAGRGDPDGVKTAAYGAAIEAAGGQLFADVDDIRPYYWEAAVVVTPIRLGAGMRNKVIHAMACGAPLVTSTWALEGVPAEAARHAVVADEAEGFARAVLETLDDPAKAEERAKAAAVAVAALATPAVADRFEAWWQGVVRAGR